MSNTTTPPGALDEVRAWGKREEKRAQAAEAERDALRAEIDPLRREAALWRAGVRYDAGAQLILQQLPPDLDLDDPEAVRAACSTVVAAVLGARDGLAKVRA